MNKIREWDWPEVVLMLGFFAIVAVTVLGIMGRLGPAHSAPEHPDARPAVGATLPPCDADVPGLPVTGPCWLWDDDTIAVWPYPYAPAPLYMLAGSKS